MNGSPQRCIRNSVDHIRQKFRTRRGHNVIVYLICLAAAFLFWVIMTLDETTERDYHVSVELVNVPDSVVLVGDVPSSVNVVVKGKGTQFLRYSIMSVPTLKIDFRQYATADNYLRLSRAKLDVRIRELFGQGVSVVSVVPDSIRVGFTTGKGYKVPLKVNANVSASGHSTISGPVTAAFDSVTIYTLDNNPPDLDMVETEELRVNNLSDTTVVNVALKRQSGMRMIPDHVNVTVPVEMLVSKKCSLPIKVVNLPENTHLITYPSAIEVSYLTPMRLSNTPIEAQAVIDYNSISPSSRYAAVSVQAPAGGFKIVSVSQDSVEYVVER
ncbi:MAG: hypothetical protein NC111_00155 [Bacteroides sp.]|nr:hypothetical protein [Bacteroides sp.]MCM1412777.1 hypothetical protein [Bacteroides sp.]MCM1470929.1 hypothetical protein [Bacteroides sp.]